MVKKALRITTAKTHKAHKLQKLFCLLTMWYFSWPENVCCSVKVFPIMSSGTYLAQNIHALPKILSVHNIMSLKLI